MTNEATSDSATAVFTVTGMHCGSCSGLIDDELADLPGVTKSVTDAAAGQSTVTYNPAAVTADTIVRTITDAGDFTAALLS